MQTPTSLCLLCWADSGSLLKALLKTALKLYLGRKRGWHCRSSLKLLQIILWFCDRELLEHALRVVTWLQVVHGIHLSTCHTNASGILVLLAHICAAYEILQELMASGRSFDLPGTGHSTLICCRHSCSLQGSCTSWLLRVPSNSADAAILWFCST